MNIQPDGQKSPYGALSGLKMRFRCALIDAELQNFHNFSAHAEILGDFINEFTEKMN